VRRVLPAALAVLITAAAANAAGPDLPGRLQGPQLLDLRIDNGSTPYAGDSALLTTVSPNDDGFRDAARIHFRLQAPAVVTMDVTRTVKVPHIVYTLTETLGAGAHIMGVAVDDLHRLRVDADPPAYPGSGWIETFGERHDPSSVCDALRRGRLYASTGPSLRRISVTETTYTVWPREGGTTVRFIGRGGRILETRGPLAEGEPGSHVLGDDDGYVRATITDSANKTAWTPAVFEAP